MTRPTLPKPQPTLNPVIAKELRSRMRGGRAFAILTAYLLVLGAVTYGLYRIVLTASRFDPGGLLSARIGQTLFGGLAFFELFLILFITPALTAGTISSEKEKLTYEMLVATPLKPRAILSGKLIAAMSYVLLLIFAAVPLASLVFIFGGVAPGDMLLALGVLIITALTWGIVGLFFSALTGRTVRATILSYSLLLLATVGSVFATIVWGIVRQAEPPRVLLFLNPFSAMASVMAQALPNAGLPLGIPFAALAGEWPLLRDPTRAPLVSFRPTWHYTTALYIALSITLYLINTQLVKPVRRWRIGRAGAAVVLICLLLFGAGGYVLFRPLAAEIQALPTPVPPPADVIVVPEAPVPPPPPPMPTPTPASGPFSYPAPPTSPYPAPSTPTPTPTPGLHPSGPSPAPQEVSP